LCDGLRHKDLGFVRTGIVNASSVAKSTPLQGKGNFNGP
jgi:hypothetical protein